MKYMVSVFHVHKCVHEVFKSLPSSSYIVFSYLKAFISYVIPLVDMTVGLRYEYLWSMDCMCVTPIDFTIPNT